MRKIAMIAVSVTILVAVSLVAVWGLSDLKPAQASVPQVSHAGWSVTNFTGVEFEERQWDNIGQVGSCVIFRSRAGIRDPASLTVTTTITEFNLEYPNIGARVVVCAGFTMFLPPLSDGLPPVED